MKNLKISALNMELTEAIRQHLKERMDSLDKYLDPNDESIECDARVSQVTDRSGEIFKAEVRIHTAGKNFGADSKKQDLYEAIDDVKDKVERKIVSHKKKQRSIFKRSAARAKKLLRGFRS